MDLDALNSFLTVVQFMSFTKAANFLHVSQSTLSRQVGALEKELGAQLLIRNNRGLQLTPAGEVLVKGGMDLNSTVSELSKRVARIASGKLGSLSIVLPTISCPLFYRACTLFHNQYPNILISMQVPPIEEIFSLILTGSVDLACTFSYSLPSELDNFGVISLQENTFGLVGRPDYPLMQAYDDKIPLKALEHETIFGLTDVTLARNFLASNINNAKQLDHLNWIFPRAQHQTVSASSMIIQTQTGLGLACLPYALFSLYASHLTFREIADLDTRHQILLIFRKDNGNSCLKLFLQVLSRLLEAGA